VNGTACKSSSSFLTHQAQYNVSQRAVPGGSKVQSGSLRFYCILIFIGLGLSAAVAEQAAALPRISIPHLSAAPSLEDFLSMAPGSDAARQMLKVTGFVQRYPHGGEPVTQRTEAYLGYDSKNFYAVWVCFDDPKKVRAHLGRREDIYGDDEVEIMLDTFQDKRRAYAFQMNPLGVQWDAIWTEVPREDTFTSDPHFDVSFDTLWYSKGKLTGQGYVVWLAVPFRSLRFVPKPDQQWGVILYRGINRNNENAFWPEISLKVEGRLNQAATAEGIHDVSPGRNIQLIPYAAMRAFRAPDLRGDTPAFSQRAADGRIGLDSKFVLKDNLVLDTTINPDFSQVESDEPQITVNQRFAVFFPEKRPFFLENADYFSTPIDLLFTRDIGDPSAGIRLTGKTGPYSIGVLATDDRSPGKAVPDSDPLSGERAYFTVARVKRDLWKQSSLGFIYTDRELPFTGSFNRIGGIDGRLKFNRNWTSVFQGVVSSTREGSFYEAGPAYKANVQYTTDRVAYTAIYSDFSPGFTTLAGFVNRVDIREMYQNFSYQYRPKSGLLLAATGMMEADPVWAHDGTRLDTYYRPSLQLDFKRQSFFNVFPYTEYRERLRPSDFPGLLTANQDYHEHYSSISGGTSPFSQLALAAYYYWGDRINFVPAAVAAGQPSCNTMLCAPYLARWDEAIASLTLKPIRSVKIENSYLFSRLRSREESAAIYNNHILRSKVNWQFTRELSLRLILQYNSTLANTQFTSLSTAKTFNTDFLITYLLHPGTAVYVGYNTNLANPGLGLDPTTQQPAYLNRYTNDGRQFFVKVSYLLRF
jgi:hypothetical protein